MKRLVILGAGYAGVQAARSAVKGQHDAEVWLVDQNPYHQLVTEMYRVVGGDIAPERLTIPVERLVDRRKVHIVTARVSALDITRKTVATETGHITYDVLLLALGSEPEYFGVPGARRYAHTLQYLDSARRLKRRLKELTESPSRQPLQIVAVGGGLTGIELIAEIAEYIRHKFGFTLSVSITLIQAAPSILPEETRDLVAYAEKVLSGWDIDIRVDTSVQSVEAREVRLGTGETLPSDLTIWAGGVRANHIPAQAGLPTDKRGRVLVDSHLVVNGTPSILAAGDVALAMDPATVRPLPPTAQLAVQAGRVAGKNALLTLTAGGGLQPFSPKPLGTAASLGRHLGVANFSRFQLRGRPALALKQLSLWRYLMSVEGLGAGFSESPLSWWFDPQVRKTEGTPAKPPMPLH